MTPTSIIRVPTGIKGLDELLDGGFPMDSWIVVISPPSFDKGLFIHQFINAGLNNDEGIIYCNITKSVESIKEQCEYFGINLAKCESKGQIVYVNSYTTIEGDNDILNVKPDDDIELSIAINTALKKLSKFKYIRSVCPSTGDALFTMDKEAVKKFALSRRATRKTYSTVSLHGLVRGIRDDMIARFQFHADGAIEIETEKTDNEIQYFLRIIKMKHTDHPTKKYPLKKINDRLQLITNPLDEFQQ